MRILALLVLTACAADEASVATPLAGCPQRSYVLHVPAGYNSARAYPLMVSYHGSGGTGAGQETKTGFDAIADAYGFFVAYPDAVNGQWNSNLADACNDFAATEDMLAAIEHGYHIDASRIYASGFSEGGGMTQDLACEMPGQFAGYADVSADLHPTQEAACTSAVPSTYLVFHGTADPCSPYYGGDGGCGSGTVSALETAQFWAKEDSCFAPNSTPLAIPIKHTGLPGTSVSVQSWGLCASHGSVAFYTIANGGHTWPGGIDHNALAGATTTDLDASDVIWQQLSGDAPRFGPHGLGTLTAPATCIADTTGLCSASVAWATPVPWAQLAQPETVQVTVSVDGGAPLLFACGAGAFAQTASWIQPGHAYTFAAYQAASCDPNAARSAPMSTATIAGQWPATGLGQLAVTSNDNVVWATRYSTLPVDIYVAVDGGAATLFASGTGSFKQQAPWIAAGHAYTFSAYIAGSLGVPIASLSFIAGG
jgi:polyhydroxybutyrate depolymerase